jgi:hypothetical protein
MCTETQSSSGADVIVNYPEALEVSEERILEAYRMPLQGRNFWNLQKEPLTWDVLEAWLDDTKLHCP